MPRPPDEQRRVELLAGVVDYIATYGLAELSLRPLAAYLGTSSRMLIHYFGTKEQMLIAALETQRPDVAAMFAEVTTVAELRARLLAVGSDQTGVPVVTSTRVLMQVIGAATVTDSPFRPYAYRAVRVLVDAMTGVLQRLEPPISDPEATATLLISGVRGLIQDQLITGDSERVAAAAQQLVDRILPPSPA
ncbi:TetR/AcrR family transcriptional regulator [Nocardia stercoris]|uniref:TetR/AcrR family transcriptional regulator n=1 Tax=Nocardia stercoris TaxID=2483361 RepID=A0A3M2KX92_9NOCA|nr:TetR/AcrR family transcriptional regulator [Nocardia stercoris]RMI28125.1 TetR/AcrR family transcriptional regulator [Nocardia stercoris]